MPSPSPSPSPPLHVRNISIHCTLVAQGLLTMTYAEEMFGHITVPTKNIISTKVRNRFLSAY